MTQSGHQGSLTQPRVIFSLVVSQEQSVQDTTYRLFKTLPRCTNDLGGRIITEVDALRGQRVMMCFRE